MTRWLSLFAVVTAASLVTASAAGAATLKADYQFQDTRASSVAGAPSLVDVGTGGNAFATETVGSCAARVLTFPQGNGLGGSLAGLLTGANYSVVMLVRLNAVDSYRKLIDYKGGTDEQGLYVHDGALNWWNAEYGGDHEGPAALVPGSYAEIAFVVDIPVVGPFTVAGYVNGVGQPLANVFPSGSFPTVTGDPRFFIDDVGGSNEETGGAVSRIRFYDGALSPSEVEAIHAGSVQPPVCQPPPASPASSVTPTNTGQRAAALKKCKKTAKKKHWTKKQLKKCKKKANLLPV